MNWSDLLAVVHLDDSQIGAVEERLRVAEEANRREHDQLDGEFQRVEEQQRECVENMKKLRELQDLYKHRLAQFDALDRSKAALEERRLNFEAKHRECVKRETALKGVERDMAPTERTKLLSIVNRGCCDGAPLKILAKEDDTELFLSVTNEADELMVEQYLPRSLLL